MLLRVHISESVTFTNYTVHSTGVCFSGNGGLTDCLMSPWSPSLRVFQSVLPLPAHSLSLSLSVYPPACIIDMRQAAVLPGSKVINVLQMFLWAMKDWGVTPASHVSLPYSSLSLFHLLCLLITFTLPFLFSPPFISTIFFCLLFSYVCPVFDSLLSLFHHLFFPPFLSAALSPLFSSLFPFLVTFGARFE